MTRVETISIRTITGCIDYSGKAHVAGGPAFDCEAGEARRLIEMGVAEEATAGAAPAPALPPPDLFTLIAEAQSPEELLALMPEEEPGEEVKAAFEARLAEMEK